MRKLLTTLLVPVSVLAGCGAVNDNNGSSTKTTATNPTTPTTATPAAASGGASATGGKFVITGTEWAFQLPSPTVKAGKVKIDFKNDGKVPHELIVLKTDAKADSLKVSKGRVSETGSIGGISTIGPVKQKEKTFNLKPGHYALVCNIPSHYGLGMHSDLTVQ